MFEAGAYSMARVCTASQSSGIAPAGAPAMTAFTVRFSTVQSAAKLSNSAVMTATAALPPLCLEAGHGGTAGLESLLPLVDDVLEDRPDPVGAHTDACTAPRLEPRTWPVGLLPGFPDAAAIERLATKLVAVEALGQLADWAESPAWELRVIRPDDDEHVDRHS